ncbi:MAG: TolC family protein [Candidatus Binatia bacterium]
MAVALLLALAAANRAGAADALTLREALAKALESSPELESARLAVSAGEARARQAGALPNPELKAELENIGGSGAFRGADSAESTLRLSQLVELGGKRSARHRQAERERDVAAAELEVRRAQVVARTARAFIDALALQERVQIAEALQRLSQEARAAVDARLRAGAATQAEVLRAQLAVDYARLQREARGRALGAARATLAASWGGAGGEVSGLSGDLAAIAPPVSASAVLGALDGTPELIRWGEERAARAAALELQEARAVPDVTVGAGPRYFSDTQDGALVVELWVPLPVFNRNQGAISAARADLAAVDAGRRGAAATLRASLLRAHAELSTAYAQAVALRDRMLPTAEAARRHTAEAYQRGALGSLDVLDAQRALFALREQHVEALAQYHQATTELEQLLGASLPTDGAAAGDAVVPGRMP